MSTLEYLRENTSVTPIMTIHGVRFHSKDGLPPHISLSELKSQVNEIIPAKLFSGVKSVFIGDFEYLRSRGAQAISYNGSIFISNQQESSMEIVDDLAHELGHMVEKKYYHNIHSNPTLEKEFLQKKKLALDLLSQSSIKSTSAHLKASHDPALDDLLSNTIGLHNLEKTFANLVVTPYSLISLSEYFSEGLEFYLLNDVFYLQNLCPILYNVIETIIES